MMGKHTLPQSASENPPYGIINSINMIRRDLHDCNHASVKYLWLGPNVTFLETGNGD